MLIKDLRARQGDIELTAQVTEMAQPRAFNKDGRSGKVCNAKIKDESGSVTLTLWNDDADKLHVGDTIKIIKGYVGEWQGELQLSAGKFGQIEVVSKAPVASASVQKNQDEEEESSDDFEEPDVNEEDVF